MAGQTVARRYATALADVVNKSGDVEGVKNELSTWEQLIAGNAALHSAFANPSIAASKKEGVLEALIGKTNPSKVTSNFLRILLRNGRLTDLADINTRFESVLEERSGVVTGQIVSTHELSAAERKELETSLEKVTGKDVKLTYRVDGNIIGGIVARIGSTVYDGSVRTQLENLKEQLLNG